jgi:hypothetical protein
MARIRETLSNTRPILSSLVVARIRNWVIEVARRRRVWPPDTSRVRNGNLGGLGVEVKTGVRACACFRSKVNVCREGKKGKKVPCGGRRRGAFAAPQQASWPR